MTKQQAESIYTLLVNHGGAPESMRDAFVHHHVTGGYPEWRFGGSLGFGGKYYAQENRVDCYSEDYSNKRKSLIEQINTALKSL